MSHIKFRQQLAMTLVEDFLQGGGESAKGQHSTSDKEHRVNGKLHIIIPHPDRKHKDCVLCFKINVSGGRRETIYIFETYDHNSGHHVGKPHSEKLKLKSACQTLKIQYIHIYI